MKTLKDRGRVSWIARSTFAVTILIVASHGATAQTNTFPANGNAGVGTTSPGEKLVTIGNVLAGNINGHTQLYPGFDSQTPSILEVGYGTATSSETPFSALVLSKNATGTSQYIGSLFWANRAIADGSEKRLAQIASSTDGATNSGLLTFNTTNAGTLAERMRINKNGNVGIGTTSPGNLLHADVNSASMGTDSVSVANRGVNTLGHTTGLRFQFNTAVPAAVRVRLGNLTTGAGDLGLFTSSDGTATNLAERLTVQAGGNVGIGTTNPQNALQVAGSLLLTGNTTMSNPASVGPAFNAGYYSTGGYSFFQGFNYTTSSYIPLYADGSKLVINANSNGNVGIGTANPNSQYKLDVAGNINSSGTITGNNIVAKYQDVAEWVPSTQQLSAGTVVVLDSTKSNEVIASSQAYDTRVAGVISEQPGIALGERGAGKVLVATTGRVRVKIDASKSAIQIGDLLVTSDVPGVAMKSEPVNLGGVQLHRPGTIVGKALEPFAKGSGEILVLLSLQ